MVYNKHRVPEVSVSEDADSVFVKSLRRPAMNGTVKNTACMA